MKPGCRCPRSLVCDGAGGHPAPHPPGATPGSAVRTGHSRRRDNPSGSRTALRGPGSRSGRSRAERLRAGDALGPLELGRGGLSGGARLPLRPTAPAPRCPCAPLPGPRCPGAGAARAPRGPRAPTLTANVRPQLLVVLPQQLVEDQGHVGVLRFRGQDPLSVGRRVAPCVVLRVSGPA